MITYSRAYQLAEQGQSQRFSVLCCSQQRVGTTRVRFAINYSPQAEKLWRAGAIQVDVFKCPDWPELVKRVGETHQVYVHCGLFAGHDQQAQVAFSQLQKWLEKTDTLVINAHLAVLRSDLPRCHELTAEAVIARAAQDVERLGERFGIERIVVENMPYPIEFWPDEMLPEAVDPALISELVRRTGCGFLLDVAHAIRACEGSGRADIRAYLSGLPVHALRELHIVGLLPEADERGIRYDHFAMTESDWETAEWAVEQIRAGAWQKPDTLAFEYGGVGKRFAWRSDEAVIAEQVPRLYQLAHSV